MLATNKTYNPAIIGFGSSNFMSYAAYFCKDEGQNGAVEIVSAGSGDGKVERGIIAAYRKHFGEELDITLVDCNPKFEVHFRTVDDLIKKRPNVVGNCVLLIIWPWNYDIDAVRQLQPRAALTAYETTGAGGTEEFRAFLRDKKKDEDDWRGAHRYEDEDLGLGNYAVEEVAYREILVGVRLRASDELGVRAYRLRMARMKRMGDYTSTGRKKKTG
jgi:hypothetical protein